MTTGELVLHDAPASVEPVENSFGLPSFMRSRFAVASAIAVTAFANLAPAAAPALAEGGSSPDSSLTCGPGWKVIETSPDGSQVTCAPSSDPNQAPLPSTSDGSANHAPRSHNRGHVAAREKYARQVFRLIQQKRISIELLNGGLNAQDMQSMSTPLDNVEDAMVNRPSFTSKRCGNAGKRETYINPKVLKFLSEVGKRTHIWITTIVGGCHTDSSEHYAGNAVDFGCGPQNSISSHQESIMVRIGRKVGMYRYMGEDCAANANQHFSTTGD